MSLPPQRVRRIAVAIDPSVEVFDVLEAAMALAAEMQAEVEAVFIEDDALFRLCDLPGAAVGLTSGALTRFDRAALERDLRHRAAAVRRRVESLAVSRRVAWSFQVSRGRAADVALQVAGETDVVALSRRTVGAGEARSRRQAPAPVLAVLEEAADDGVLPVAASVATQLRVPLVVFAPPAVLPRLRPALAVLERERHGLHAEARPLPQAPEMMRQAIAAARGRLLVLHAGADAAATLTRFPDSEIWLVRG